MATWFSRLHEGSKSSSRFLGVLEQYGDERSRDNTSLSWAEFELFGGEFTASPCLILDNVTCDVNVTSSDDTATYAYTVWQVCYLDYFIKSCDTCARNRHHESTPFFQRRFLVRVSCKSQIGFVWYQILAPIRTLLYSKQELEWRARD